MPDVLPVLTAAWIVLLALPAAVSDARSGTIPNWLTLPTLATAPLLAWWLAGAAGFGFALAGAFVCGLVPLLLFRAGAGGGGDVKLLAALGAIGGARLGLEIQMTSFTLATLWALGGLAWRRQLWPTLGRSLLLLVRPVLPASMRAGASADPATMTTVRLGPAVLLASVTVLAARNATWP